MQDHIKNLKLYHPKFTKIYQMSTWIDIVTHVMHCWTLSWILQPAQKFSSPMSAQFIAVPMAVVHQYLPSHYPSHHIVPILLHQTTLCGALSRKKWLHTTITTMTTCAELWNRHSPPLCHKCFGRCHTQHGSSSGCFKHDGEHTEPLDVQWLSPHGTLSRDTVTSQPPCISSDPHWSLSWLYSALPG
jgi:hypothetical protein